jgi:hypothetical protein
MAKREREILEQAILDMNTYKHPNLYEAREILDSLFINSAIGVLGDQDTIDSIFEEDDPFGNSKGSYFYIKTSWSSRGCEQGEEYCIPSYIIDAEDPVKAAIKYRLDKALAKAQANVLSATKTLEVYQQQLLKAQNDHNSNNQA